MITFKHRGDFRHTEKFFAKAKVALIASVLAKYGEEGVRALSSATPLDSGATASSWGYEIVRKRNGVSIFWTNTHENDGANIAILLQYGHGTGWGGYVSGRDYINPVIKPVFEKIVQNVWKEVTSL